MLSDKICKKFIEIVGSENVLMQGDKFSKYCQEPRGRFSSQPAMILFPSDKYEISKILTLSHDTKTAIVPQGGNTGLVGAQQAKHSDEILLSLERLDKIYEVNKFSSYIYAQSGVSLEKLQIEADKFDRLFPLNLASKMSCQLGGNLSTNAGGVSVLTYGNTRDLCLGLEVVLPNGEILSDLRFVKKDNSGYDLKNIFIGAEGTLGIITEAVMKIFPKPRGHATSIIAFQNIEDILYFFNKAQEILGFNLTAIELMNQPSLKIAQNYSQNRAHQLSANLFLENYPYYLLIELVSFLDDEDAKKNLENLLSYSYQDSIIQNAIFAKNETERMFFWYLRETISFAQKKLGPSIKNDISVPFHNLPLFLKKAEKIVLQHIPAAKIICFGHIGDGNLHYNISLDPSITLDIFLQLEKNLQKDLYDLVMSLYGSFSAEHGIGQLKIKEIRKYKSDSTLKLMTKLKKLLDSENIMNPEKIFSFSQKNKKFF